jgi:hypothetical protein
LGADYCDGDQTMGHHEHVQKRRDEELIHQATKTSLALCPAWHGDTNTLYLQSQCSHLKFFLEYPNVFLYLIIKAKVFPTFGLV